ncbi:PRC-barrel domain containing protein [Rhizohabitans arisaemae]|uniref:PRC-barrel domain containing protein n=1 Tax=Rhizohabitans arisaemae TaxID=2720610 RepID=UPI0024B1C9EC|nr:PRC-barrel domain containing protein [Rhizohabitans arisaemae]
MAYDIWGYRATSKYAPGADLVGYRVEAVDGSIGKVAAATEEVGSAHLIVDTGPWIFGKHVMLPAGVVQEVDPAEQRVYVDRTKEEIKSAPRYDAGFHHEDVGYREKLGHYYGPFYLR